MDAATKLSLRENVRQFVLEGFRPRFGLHRAQYKSNPLWTALRHLGTELWLDTGSLDEASELWTQEFTALTTNNTLLNKEVQKGQYDDLILRSADLLAEHGLSEQEVILEIAFILNARHALRLVEEFDAYISVEEHTALAHDVDAAVEYGRRYHEICPERFIIKIPFTPAGLLATRRLSDEKIPVNHTLGFSARQNYVITRLGRPRYVNVFLGRLSSFIVDNKLGDGRYIGERATLASQATVRSLGETLGLDTMQIGASFREPGQVRDLAGIDVMTMPPKVASGFLELGLKPEEVTDHVAEQYETAFAPGVDHKKLRLDSFWEINQPLADCVDALEKEDLSEFTADELVHFFAGQGCRDFLVNWTNEQRDASYAEGKIPRIENWRAALESGEIAADSLMNLAGLSSFTADQKAMDDRVRSVLAKGQKV